MPRPRDACLREITGVVNVFHDDIVADAFPKAPAISSWGAAHEVGGSRLRLGVPDWSVIAVWQWVAAGAVGLALAATGGMAIGRRRQNGAGTGEPWVLRHALVVVAVGAAGAIGAFVLTYRATDGADKDRFDVAIKAATAAAALAAGLLTWGRLGRRMSAARP